MEIVVVVLVTEQVLQGLDGKHGVLALTYFLQRPFPIQARKKEKKKTDEKKKKKKKKNYK